jgi:hypothetical protein
MMEPLPNCFSIWPSAAANAFCLFSSIAIITPVMQHGEQGLPLLIHLQHQRHQHIAGDFINAGKRFIEHHQRSLLHEYARKQHEPYSHC